MLDDILQRIQKNREQPLQEVARKGLDYLVSTARTKVVLRACDSVGPGTRVSGLPRVVNEGHISMGANLLLMSTWNPVELVTSPGGRIEIGRDVSINFGTSIRAGQRVSIGDEAMIGQYCILDDGEEPERVGGAQERTLREPREIIIGKGAWLAGRVTVLPGVTIGDGAVISAGSVVESDIPAGVIAGGIPARVLRKLAPGAAARDSAIAEHAAFVPPAAAPSAPAPAPARPKIEHRGLLLADFTIDELTQRLSDDVETPGLEAETGFFDQVAQTLLQGVPAERAQFAIVWTRPEAALPSFARVAAFESAAGLDDALLAEVDAFCALIAQGCAQQKAVFVPSWTMPPWQRGFGMLDARPGGATRALALANARLFESLAKIPNAYALNAQRWIDAAGKGAHNIKGWYLGKVPFSGEVFAEAVRDVKAALRGLSGQARKLIVVDLDDTLWGGIVGDVGWQQLRLGGHDGVGEALVDFQRQLKALTRRGIVLGIVSKNEESVALEAIDKHPAMVLKREDFVGYRINWNDKARNVAELAAELNLGLQSVVFLDDNPAERARVRETLPEVLVPEWPADPMHYPSALASLRCFDAPALSREDLERTQMYGAEKKREALRAQVTDLDEWLKTLGIHLKVEALGAANLARSAQLLNKTNQLNLSTRRLTEAELTAWAVQPGRALYALSVSDRFGDAGLTGLLSVEREGNSETARVVDFVLSCRVMGRKIEQAMLHLAVEEARALGAARLEARLLPTAKNKPTREVFDKAGLERPEENLYAWPAAQDYALPASIALERIR